MIAGSKAGGVPPRSRALRGGLVERLAALPSRRAAVATAAARRAPRTKPLAFLTLYGA